MSNKNITINQENEILKLLQERSSITVNELITLKDDNIWAFTIYKMYKKI